MGKIKEFFDEHPYVKKGLIIAGHVALIAGGFYVGGKILESNKNNTPKLPEVPKLPEIPEIPEVPKLPEIQESVNAFIPRVVDDDNFDMIFKDCKTGIEYIIENSCQGSYVNDMLEDCDSWGQKISIKEPDLHELAEIIVEDVINDQDRY